MSISKAEHDELCCVYAALLLHDDNVEITADKLNKVISASGNTVESYYPEFFEKYFKNANLKTLLENVSSAPAGGAVAATTAPAEKKEGKYVK
jgi:large subunit ribosomal protein LP1